MVVWLDRVTKTTFKLHSNYVFRLINSCNDFHIRIYVLGAKSCCDCAKWDRKLWKILIYLDCIIFKLIPHKIIYALELFEYEQMNTGVFFSS